MISYYKTFISLGNCKQHFIRLLNVSIKCIDWLPKPILIQAGHTPFSHEKCDVIDFIHMDTFIHHIEKAEILILHAGAGSTMHAVNSGKYPILMPRRKKFNEHVNDHQVTFSKMLYKEGRTMIVEDEASLKQAINQILSQKLTNTKKDISRTLHMFRKLLQQI